MFDTHPSVVVIAGPNGSGKSTAAPALLGSVLGVTEFVNVDVIAQGLSAFNPERAAITAGRVMLARIKELAVARESFAFETTLASRTFAPWLTNLIADGYDFHLIYLWLPSAEMAVERVAQRVQEGGHHVAEEVVRRRYRKGLRNFFHFTSRLRPNGASMILRTVSAPRLIAIGSEPDQETVFDQKTWQVIRECCDK
jgi:predicted ABC-type ATPase